MTQQKGVTSALVIGEESAFGTQPSAGFVVPFNTFGVVASQTVNAPATISGTRNPVEPFRGNKDVGGSIVVPVDSSAFWYWLQMMFGDPTTAGAGPYTHTFDIGNTQPSYTLESQFTDLLTDVFYQYLGCKASRWSMTLGGDGELVSTIDVIGADSDPDSSSFDASPTTMTIDRLDNFEASLTEGGGAISNVTEVSFTVDFGLDPSNFVIGGSGARGAIPEGIVDVSGNIKTLFEDTSLITKAVSGTESAIIITIQEDANHSLVIEFNELQYSLKTPEISGPQGLLVDLDFQAYYENHADASAVVAVLTNQDAHA